MKKTLQYICAVVLTVTMGACNQSMEPEEIFETQKSGVVLVLNKFYYQVEMPSGQKLYFTGLDSNGELQGFTADEEEVKQHPAMLNGTGFFIDKEGTLVTNRHVAATELDEKQMKANLQCMGWHLSPEEIRLLNDASLTGEPEPEGNGI